ncbi:HTH domain-containing protein [Leuconostoc mesenteroides]
MLERQVDLFTKLCTTNQFFPANFFAKRYGVSKKTIYKDIERITDLLKETNVRIVKKRRLGLKVYGSTLEKQEVLDKIVYECSDNDIPIISSLQARRAVMVKQIILENKKIALQDFFYKWIVSKTSVLNDIAIINNIISSSSIQIKSDGQHMFLDSKEESRQIATVTYIIATSKNSVSKRSNKEYLKLFFPEDILLSVENFFRSVSNVYQYDIEYVI